MDQQKQSGAMNKDATLDTPNSMTRFQKLQSNQFSSQQEDNLISELNSKKSSYIKKQTQNFPEIESYRSDDGKMQLLLSPRSQIESNFQCNISKNNSVYSNQRGRQQQANKRQASFRGVLVNSNFGKKNSVPANIENSESNMANNVTAQLQYHMRKVYELGKKTRFKNFLIDVIRNQESVRKRRLTEAQMRTLNDNAIVLKQKRHFNNFGERVRYCWQTLDQTLAKICSTKPIHPYNTFNLLSQIIENIFIIFCLFIYTLFCFYDYFWREFFFYTGVISIVIFSFGTYLRVNSGYFDQGVIVKDRAKIIQKYRQDIMFYDLVGFCGQIYQILANDNEQYTKLLTFLLICKFKVYLYNLSKIEERMNLTGNMIYLWQLVKLMCTALALCHFVGTAYYFLAFIESYYLEYTNTWVDVIDFWEQAPHVKYIESYYWALATMTLIGTKGSTVIETAFCVCVLTCTIGIFATILSTFSMVYDEMDKKMKSFKNDRDILNSFFELHSLPNDLQGQLQNYLKYSFEGHKEKTASQNFEQLMKKFPKALQELVKKERYSREIQKFSLLSKNFSVTTIRQLINYIQEEYFMPNQIIVQSGEIQERKLYLILTGEAEIYSIQNKKENQIQVLKPGDYFGEDTFFTGGQPFYSIKSKENSFTTVISLSQTDFTNIIYQQGLEGDKEKYYFIKDQIKSQGYSPILNRQCYLCGGRQHNEQNCNMIFFYPKVLQLIAKYNLSENQVRQKFDEQGEPIRGVKRKIDNFNTLLQYQIVNARQYIFLDQANIQLEMAEIQDYQRNYIMNNFNEDTVNSFLDLSDSLEESQGIYGQERSKSILEFSSRQHLINQFQNSASLNNNRKESVNYTIQEHNQYEEEDENTYSNFLINNNINNISNQILNRQQQNLTSMNSSVKKNGLGKASSKSLERQINQSQLKFKRNNNNYNYNDQSGKGKLQQGDLILERRYSDGYGKGSRVFESQGQMTQDSAAMNYSINDIEEYKQVDAFKLNQFDMFQKNLKQQYKFLNPEDVQERNQNYSKIMAKNQMSPQNQYTYINQNSLNPTFLKESSTLDIEKRRKSHFLSNKFQQSIFFQRQSQPKFSKRLQKSPNHILSPLNPSQNLKKQKLSLTNNLLKLRTNQRKSNSQMSQVNDPVFSGMFQILLDLQNTLGEFVDMYVQGEQAKVEGNQLEKIQERLFKTEFFLETDRMALFRYYFPRSNYDNILTKYKQWQTKNTNQVPKQQYKNKKFKNKVRNVISAQQFLAKSQRMSDQLNVGSSQMILKQQ